MKKCPYCAEEIQDEAIKCRYCGAKVSVRITGIVPNSLASKINLKKDDIFLLIDEKVTDSRNSVDKIKDKIELGKPFDIKVLRDRELITIEASFTNDKFLGVYFSAPSTASGGGKGKFSCPKCNSEYTECHKAIGCAVLIIIFISFGLGLIMIPFLPYECYCTKCGHKWKT